MAKATAVRMPLPDSHPGFLRRPLTTNIDLGPAFPAWCRRSDGRREGVGATEEAVAHRRDGLLNPAGEMQVGFGDNAGVAPVREGGHH